jgi:hypothetical protein
MAAEDRTQGRTRTLLAAFAVAWLVLSAVGFGLLIRYGSTPARANAHHPERWPAASAVARSAELPTLVQFIHPRCTCSRASLAELERLMARIAGRAEARVVIVRPHGDEADFQVAALEERVRRIPATRAALDADGRESDAFGAATSGTTLLYGSDGRLLFAGGLTASRGHEGPSPGQERVVALLTGAHADRPDSPVFGCSLHGY